MLVEENLLDKYLFVIKDDRLYIFISELDKYFFYFFIEVFKL